MLYRHLKSTSADRDTGSLNRIPKIGIAQKINPEKVKIFRARKMTGNLPAFHQQSTNLAPIYWPASLMQEGCSQYSSRRPRSGSDGGNLLDGVDCQYDQGWAVAATVIAGTGAGAGFFGIADNIGTQ